MFTKFKNWIKEKWLKLKQWGKVTFGVSAAMAASVTGADMAQFKAQPLPDRTIIVAEEQVKQKQVGNVAEVEMPWKGERGLKVKYDMGEVSAEERIKDKRNKQVVTETVDFGEGGFKIDIVLDKKPDTNTFCYTIEGYENYNFFYQPPLTQEEIVAGNIRPEEIEGSYAVYHKTLKDYIVGKTNYKTGKVMHIPFPYVWEVKNEKATKQRAENLTYNEGQLCVVVQEDFLRKAKYPVRIDPTFGYTSIGSSAIVNSDDTPSTRRIGNSKVALSATSTFVSISVAQSTYLPVSSSDTLETKVYLNLTSSSGTASNDEYLAITKANTFLTNTMAWIDYTGLSQTLYPATDYLINITANGGDLDTTSSTLVAMDSVIDGELYHAKNYTGASAYTDSQVDPWVDDGNIVSGRLVSMYVTYTIDDNNLTEYIFQTQNGNDDGFCYTGTGNCFTVALNNRIGYRSGFGDIVTGFRFSNIDIEKDAIIKHAYFVYTAFDTDATTDSVNIYAEATSTSQAFTDTGYFTANTVGYGGNRATTTAVVPWTLPNQVQEVFVTSPDIASVIQEVVNRSDWSSGNPLSIIIGNAGASDNHNANSNPLYSYLLISVDSGNDSCTYTSGDWNVLYSDNCNITSDTYVTGACNLIYDGAGSFGLQATLSCDEVNGGQGFMIQGLNDSGKLNIY